ncbi:MAG: outer membrane beta-barrel protein [Alphaproteobacteria bacterium]|nr:outer membrane beta-barrel protein [Alphaproteobacteria bacterium]
MNAKKRVSLLLLCAIPALYAESQEPFSGFVVGLNLGADLLTGSNKYESPTGAGESSLRKIGMAYGLSFGYMKLMPSKVLWGGEVYYTVRSTKATQNMFTTMGEGTLTVQHKNSMGIAALVGMAANPRLVAYGKFALESNMFDMSYKSLARGAQDKSEKKRILGMIPGAGMMYKLSDSILVGIEYAYAVMKELKTDAGAVKSSYKPAQNRLMANIRYLF